MNKKAQFAKTMTTIPVMMMVIALMVLFVLASSWAEKTRETGNQKAFINYNLIKSDILFETIEINGNKILVAEEMIREFRKSSSSRGYKVFEEPLIDSIKNIMNKDINFKGKELCAYIGIGEYLDGARIDYTSIGSETGAVYGGRAFKKDKEGNARDSPFSPDMTKKLNEVKINVDGKRVGVISYYGECSDKKTPIKSSSEMISLTLGEKIPLKNGHNISLLDVHKNRAALLIESEPVYFSLEIGDDKKITLSNEEEVNLKLVSINQNDKTAQIEKTFSPLSQGSSIQERNDVVQKVPSVYGEENSFPNEKVFSVGWEKYAVINKSSFRYLFTSGVDGCVAAVVILSDGDKVTMTHFHWNNEKTKIIMSSMLNEIKDELNGGAYAVLLGGYKGKSESLIYSVKSSFEENCIKVIGIDEEMLDNKIRDVLYDLSDSSLHIKVYNNFPESSIEYNSYKIIIDELLKKNQEDCNINKEQIVESLNRYFSLIKTEETGCDGGKCLC